MGLVAVGAVLVAVSALADQLGIGSDGTGLGWKQIVGIVVDVIVAAVGFGLGYLRPAGREDVSASS